MTDQPEPTSGAPLPTGQHAALIAQEAARTQTASTTDDGLEQQVGAVMTELSPITKQYLLSVTSSRVEGNRYFFSDGRSTVCLSVISDEIIRVRMAPQSVFLDDFSYAVAPGNLRISKIDFEETTTSYIISTNTVVCTIDIETFHIAFADRNHVTTNEDFLPMHWEENSDFGGYYVYCTKKAVAGEAFYGLGDKPTDLNLAGKRFSLWGSDTYAFTKHQDPLYRNIPFYIGLHGGASYGLFFDNTFRTFFDFANEDTQETSFWADGGELNYYYIHGPQMMDVVKRYAALTGTHAMPPLWALGFHQCRWSYFPEIKVKEIADGFRSRKIPCDAIYLDIDYMDGYRCFTWNKKHFPDPKRMIAELKNDGFNVVVIIDPGIKVDENYFVYKEAKEHNYFCRRSDDYFMEGHVWPGRCQFPDFTNPEVRAWWGKLFNDFIELGVGGIWNDMNEPAVFGLGTFPNDVRHHFDGRRGSHRKAHNVYGMQMVRATYEGLNDHQVSRRPFTITRSGYAGVQRYSSVWTGDNVSSWEHLKLASTMCQRLSISGISFCGSDIGGFTGEPDGELFTRWIQLGVFAPLMRAHSAGDTPEREPWSFGQPYEDVCRKYIELRYKLLLYIYCSFWEHHTLGVPILRPLILCEQENAENINREDEFLFGNKLLIHPIHKPGTVCDEVYLPSGLWYDYWTGSRYQGGKTHLMYAPLDVMPIFVKSGSVIPEHPVMQYTGQFELSHLRLNMYFDDFESKSMVYEDHGDNHAFEQGIHLERNFTLSGTSASLTVTQKQTGSFKVTYQNFEVFVYGIPFVATKVMCDRVEIPGFKMEHHVASFICKKDFTILEILA